MQKAIKGDIYRFLDRDGSDTEKFCIVVSSNHRATDKLISIIVLGTKEGADSVPVKELHDLTHIDYFAHCGLVTYCDRGRLGQCVASASTDTIKEIDKSIIEALGITDYEDMYNMILDKMMAQKGAEK